MLCHRHGGRHAERTGHRKHRRHPKRLLPRRGRRLPRGGGDGRNGQLLFRLVEREPGLFRLQPHRGRLAPDRRRRRRMHGGRRGDAGGTRPDFCQHRRGKRHLDRCDGRHRLGRPYRRHRTLRVQLVDRRDIRLHLQPARRAGCRLCKGRARMFGHRHSQRAGIRRPPPRSAARSRSASSGRMARRRPRSTTSNRATIWSKSRTARAASRPIPSTFHSRNKSFRPGSSSCKTSAAPSLPKAA